MNCKEAQVTMIMQFDEEIAVSNKEECKESADDTLNPRQAAEYLGRLWGRPFTAKDFINLRTNAQKRAEALGVPLLELFPIEPAFSDTRISMWRRGDLQRLVEAIEPPKLREDVRGPRRKRGNSGS